MEGRQDAAEFCQRIFPRSASRCACHRLLERHHMKALVRFSAVALAVIPLAAVGQEARELPSGREVVDRFVEATGGKEKYEAIKTMTAKGKFEIRGFSGGTIELLFAAPDKARLNVTVDGFGKVEKGYLGQVAWEESAATGARLMEGEEASRFLEGLNLKATYAPESIYESIENAGIEAVEDERCYKVAMKRKGSEDVDYTFYSIESGLAVKTITHEPLPTGKVTVSTTLSEYEEVDGIKSPTKMVQELADLGMTQEIEIESVKYNEPIEDSAFELPKAAKELADKAKSAK
jgi:hypothetical protein